MLQFPNYNRASSPGRRFINPRPVEYAFAPIITGLTMELHTQKHNSAV